MATEILMPALSPTMEEGTLAKWNVKEGDKVSSGDVICEIETDKATMEFESIDDGVMGKILIAEGTEGVKVNARIAVLLEEGEEMSAAVGLGSGAQATPAPAATPKAEAAVAEPAPSAPDGSRVFASPLARRIAADKGLDLASIAGSGPRGRIVKADVENAQPVAATAPAIMAEAPKAAKSAGMATGMDADTVKKIYANTPYEEVKLDGMRKIIAARLTEAKQTIPHFYLRRGIALDALLAFRADLNASLAARGVKLSVNDFIIKACALALQQHPDCNAAWAGDRVLKFKGSDVAVAVAIEGGLFTPVLRDAQSKSLSALSAEMKDLADRARNRKLAPHEYQGGSFAISNLGMFGIENFDAVINPPHASILAVGAGTKKPIVGKDGEVTVATIMSVTLSVDHRVIDGALGAQFLEAVKTNLENPLAMLA
ncbi:MAG: pyruvate dehydrogenase E2 component (dihydrolipoamide acetyltransferase) [Paracoccaceae bacterium]|jgi:pyruvate dehydrogenase E2 component (dihydrolipoamide acetyltransferase)